MVAILTCNELRGLALAVALTAPSALAQDKPDPNEAARHFDRGYLLAQQGSLEAALARYLA